MDLQDDPEWQEAASAGLLALMDTSQQALLSNLLQAMDLAQQAQQIAACWDKMAKSQIYIWEPRWQRLF